MPRTPAIMTDAVATRSLCPRVYRSFVSTAWTRARTVDSYAACSAVYCEIAQRATINGSTTRAADRAPIEGHRTAISRPRRLYPRYPGAVGSRAERMTRMGGTRSAVHSTPTSRPPLTTQGTTPAARTAMTTAGWNSGTMNLSWL